MRNLLKKGNIDFHPNSSIDAIDETTIRINSPEETVTIQNDYVFSLIGYQPNIFDASKRWNSNRPLFISSYLLIQRPMNQMSRTFFFLGL